MKLSITIIITKLIYFISNTFRIGSGYTWSGYIALKMYPDVFRNPKLSYSKGVILISGTNGKTTTSKIISHVLKEYGFKVTHNISGANLLHGVLSSMLLDRDIFGNTASDYGVFEVDEFSLPKLLQYIEPKALILLNLSRDQLDRYGEVDTILNKWIDSIKSLRSKTTLILYKDQEEFSKLSSIYEGNTMYFTNESKYLKYSNLKGIHNDKNLNASFTLFNLLGLNEDKCIKSLSSLEAAYGRGEKIKYKDTSFEIYLAKNPDSFNNNLDLLINEDFDRLIFILNDNIPDGRDISWIYDVDPLLLKKVCDMCKGEIYVCGTRYLDMAVRLTYSGVKILDSNISLDIKDILSKCLKNNPDSKVCVLPNYSSMLGFRKILTGKAIL